MTEPFCQTCFKVEASIYCHECNLPICTPCSTLLANYHSVCKECKKKFTPSESMSSDESNQVNDPC